MIAVIRWNVAGLPDTQEERIEVREKADTDKVIEACCHALNIFADHNDVSFDIMSDWITDVRRVAKHQMGYSCNAFNLRWEPS